MRRDEYGNRRVTDLESVRVPEDGRLILGGREDPEPNCTVCLDDFNPGEEVRITRCNHAFHNRCIQPWFRQNPGHETCPNCKD